MVETSESYKNLMSRRIEGGIEGKIEGGIESRIEKKERRRDRKRDRKWDRKRASLAFFDRHQKQNSKSTSLRWTMIEQFPEV